MGSYNPMINMPEEENLIAAAKLILRELESNKKLSNEATEILEHLATKLSSIAKITKPKDEKENGDEELSDIKLRLDSIQEKIMTWEVGQSMIWDSGSNETNEYLKAVNEVKGLVERFESLNPDKDTVEHEVLRKANDVLQTSMARIEEEFKHILVHNRQNFEPERLSFRSNDDDGVDSSSIISFEDDSSSFDDSVQRDSISRGSEVHIMDLINPQVIPTLKTISNLMFDSNYSKECCHAYINVRKDALDDCLYILEVEKSSIEDVLKMEWAALNSKIRKWTKVMKIFVRIYLASEKFLCEQIFGKHEVVNSCFAESSKASILQLLNFAEAIAVGPHKPEKLIRILDMYEVLVNLKPDIESLYQNDPGSYLRTEFQDVVTRIGDCGSTTFLEFKNAVGANPSNAAFPGGGIHHLTRWVMNYVTTLIDYSNSLNTLLKSETEDQDQVQDSSSPDTSPGVEDDNVNKTSSLSPMRSHFRSLMSLLESNLEEKSRLYKEDALGHLFLMNNIHYMAEKVKGSELRTVLGDNWIRKRNWKFQQYAMSYERSTLSSILNLLKEEGLHNNGSNSGSISKTLLKERLQGFYTAFEEIYKNQTGWSIPNSQLSEDLRISLSLKVIQAYRTFVGRYANNISEKYIRYSADDLESYLLDLFEGSPRSLHSFHRK